MTEVSNTTVVAGAVGNGAFAADAIRDTATEAGKFAKKMQEEFGVSLKNIRTIGSSGLPQALNRAELVKAVQEATGLAPMEFLTPCREVELTIRGLMPEAERSQAVMVDVGSGNTKGGFLGTDGRPTCFSVPLGSVTYATRVKQAAAGKPFAEAAAAMRGTLLVAPLNDQVGSQPSLATRPVVLLAGGAPVCLDHSDASRSRPRATGYALGQGHQRLRSVGS